MSEPRILLAVLVLWLIRVVAGLRWRRAGHRHTLLPFGGGSHCTTCGWKSETW